MSLLGFLLLGWESAACGSHYREITPLDTGDSSVLYAWSVAANLIFPTTAGLKKNTLASFVVFNIGGNVKTSFGGGCVDPMNR